MTCPYVSFLRIERRARVRSTRTIEIRRCFYVQAEETDRDQCFRLSVHPGCPLSSRLDAGGFGVGDLFPNEWPNSCVFHFAVSSI
jgi:hypothetical protein